MSKNKYAKQAREARKANKKLRMCEAKTAYDTEEAAYQKGQTFYKCPHCGKFHRSGSFTNLVKKVEKRGKK